ncbi:hypothetical protein [Novosphingobium sp. PASSN1]|uniref:hypothetical protein n=1 Tax=Novosphingobium sp. PASSN1 TaxID=2015561 RepID=UPI000BDDD597|nr:hypothetical protein [Novosphingobium sp. PASSN1]OYU37291.1 MAG: hypothetical protein CFE35_02700 [Novosphingobium sp. PASSN1]
MPLYLVTPFDNLAPPLPGDTSPPGLPVPAAPAGRTPPRKRRHLADLWYILVKAGAFLGAIYLMVLGLPLLAFLMLAGGDTERLFLHLDNLAAHYLAADHGARAAFDQGTALGLFGLATLLAIWRLPVFLDAVQDGLSGDEL